MEIVPAATEAFDLPDGWVLELRPRINSSHAPDKYYHEPHTGRVFRSLPSVKRYLNGEVEPTRRRKAPKTHQEVAVKFGAPRRIVHHGKLGENNQVEGRKENAGRMGVNHKALSALPDGWIVEKVPRRTGFHVDNYYIEPTTGRRFRSIREVQRYLTADDEFAAKYKPLQMINPTAPKKPEKSINELLYELPDKITWTLTPTSSNSPEKWVAFLDSFRIPDYVRHLWEATFLFGMTAGQVNITAAASC